MDPGKGKTKRGNNSRQESNKKLRVKRTERNKERKKESGKKKRENTAKFLPRATVSDSAVDTTTTTECVPLDAFVNDVTSPSPALDSPIDPPLPVTTIPST